MRIAGAQIDIAWHDRSANHERARDFAEEAHGRKADVLIFPEMFATGFSMDTAVTPGTFGWTNAHPFSRAGRPASNGRCGGICSSAGKRQAAECVSNRGFVRK